MVVPVGGGGLVSGVALARKAVGSQATVLGVEAAASPVFTTALAQGRLVTVKVAPTLADGLAGNAEPGSVTFEIVRDLGVRITAVTEQAIEDAMRGLLTYERQKPKGPAPLGRTGSRGLTASPASVSL